MSPDNINKFISHWHNAVIACLTEPKKIEDYRKFERRLKSHIEENIRIKNMASSPLLCAMLCALNIDRNATIPKERGELYQIVLDVLLDRRDTERGIVSFSHISLNKAQKLIVLQDLAYWMVLNESTAIGIKDALFVIRKTVSTFPSCKEADVDVYQHLLERSTILRESVVGKIDFIHKTFMEYLAAKKIMEENSINLLLNHVTQDSWKEVILLSAVHANEEQSNMLIEGLINRANTAYRDEVTYAIQITAIAAKENLSRLSQELSDKVENILHSVLPIQNSSSIKTIASVGDDVIPFLKCTPNMTVQEQKNHIRALRYIGNENALKAISSYISYDKIIEKELLDSWVYFEQSSYAQNIIQKLSPKLKIDWPFEDLEGIQYLTESECISITGAYPLNSLEYNKLSHCNPKTLTIKSCKNMFYIDFIASFENIQELEIANCDDVEDVEDAFLLPSLKRLSLVNLSGLMAIDGNSTIVNNIEAITLSNCPEIVCLKFIKGCKNLEMINLDNCLSIKSYIYLEFCPKLSSIECDTSSILDELSDKYSRIVS